MPIREALATRTAALLARCQSGHTVRDGDDVDLALLEAIRAGHVTAREDNPEYGPRSLTYTLTPDGQAALEALDRDGTAREDDLLRRAAVAKHSVA